MPALAAISTYGNLFTALGVGQDQAAGMSIRLDRLATDLASFNNASVTDALDALRAGLVERAQDWRWCSAAAQRLGGPVLTLNPVPHAVDWLAYVNQPQSEAEVQALRECIRRRRPYGDEAWVVQTAGVMGLQASLRPRGRPPKKPGHQATLFG